MTVEDQAEFPKNTATARGFFSFFKGSAYRWCTFWLVWHLKDIYSLHFNPVKVLLFTGKIVCNITAVVSMCARSYSKKKCPVDSRRRIFGWGCEVASDLRCASTLSSLTVLISLGCTAVFLGNFALILMLLAHLGRNVYIFRKIHSAKEHVWSKNKDIFVLWSKSCM